MWHALYIAGYRTVPLLRQPNLSWFFWLRILCVKLARTHGLLGIKVQDFNSRPVRRPSLEKLSSGHSESGCIIRSGQFLSVGTVPLRWYSAINLVNLTNRARYRYSPQSLRWLNAACTRMNSVARLTTRGTPFATSFTHRNPH